MPESFSIDANIPTIGKSCLHSRSSKLNFSIGPAEPKAAAQTQCRIFLLPLELREMIYNYVFDTGAVDENTLARVYIISERRRQRVQNLATRQNNFKLVNFGHHHFALLKTCRAIHNECKSFLDSKIIYRFTSTLAIAIFLCGGNLDFPRFAFSKLDVLDKAFKVQMKIDTTQYNPIQDLAVVLRSMNELRAIQESTSMTEPRSLGLTLINKDDVDGTPNAACEKAQSRLAFAEVFHFRRLHPVALRDIAELERRRALAGI